MITWFYQSPVVLIVLYDYLETLGCCRDGSIIYLHVSLTNIWKRLTTFYKPEQEWGG
jgi:hypothetical protein